MSSHTIHKIKRFLYLIKKTLNARKYNQATKRLGLLLVQGHHLPTTRYEAHLG